MQYGKPSMDPETSKGRLILYLIVGLLAAAGGGALALASKTIGN